MLNTEPVKTQLSDLNRFLSEHSCQPVDFSRNKAGHLIINAKVNGVEGSFILDTGAGCSVIDNSNSETLKLTMDLDSVKSSGTGAGGNKLPVVPSKGNSLTINNIEIEDFTFSVMSLEHVTSAYKQMGITESFFGVLGADLLVHHKAVIDYAGMKLWLKNSN